MTEYAIYKGDTFLMIGTAAECAKELNIKEDSIRWMTTPTGKKRFASRKNPDKCLTAVKLEGDAE